MFPQVLKDTRDFTQRIDSTVIAVEHRNCVVFCAADIEGLYPNIPIDSALENIALGLQEAVHSSLLTQVNSTTILLAARLIFENMYVRFNNKIYHQQYGFPMGSALSPECANFFMGVIESFCGRFGLPEFDTWMQTHNARCYLKSRYIDDYGFILGGINTQHATTVLQTLARSIKNRSGLNLEMIISEEGTDFLDVHVYKPTDFQSTGKLAYRTHQKPNNKYQHRNSQHPPHVFKAIIKGELTRYCLTCSSKDWYTRMAYIFALRLQTRGYSASEILEVVKSLDYDTVRSTLLSGKPSHGVVTEEMSTATPTCSKFVKMQFNSTTKPLNCKRILLTTIDRIRSKIGKYGTRSDEKINEYLSRVNVEVCHQRARSLGSSLKSSQA
jgi:hypothetical protein